MDTYKVCEVKSGEVAGKFNTGEEAENLREMLNYFSIRKSYVVKEEENEEVACPCCGLIVHKD